MSSHRRQFLKAAGTSAAAFTILQAGSARTYAANEKLNIAAVGAGGQAAGDIRPDRDLEALTTQLMTLLHGIGPASRGGMSPQALKKMTGLALASMRE